MQYNSTRNAAAFIDKLGNGYSETVRKTVKEALEKKFGAENIIDVTIGLAEDNDMIVSVDYNDLDGASVGDTVDNALNSLLRS